MIKNGSERLILIASGKSLQKKKKEKQFGLHFGEDRARQPLSFIKLNECVLKPQLVNLDHRG